MAAAALLMCILPYGFIPWVIVAPLAALNSDDFQLNSIAEVILEEHHCLLLNGVWTQLCLSAWKQHMAVEDTQQANLCPSLGTPAQPTIAPLLSASSGRIIIY